MQYLINTEAVTGKGRGLHNRIGYINSLDEFCKCICICLGALCTLVPYNRK